MVSHLVCKEDPKDKGSNSVGVWLFLSQILLSWYTATPGVHGFICKRGTSDAILICTNKHCYVNGQKEKNHMVEETYTCFYILRTLEMVRISDISLNVENTSHECSQDKVKQRFFFLNK